MSEQVDFYILPKENKQSIYWLVCRLCAKAYKQKNRVYIHTKNNHEMRLLDNLLWTYEDLSFIPHECVGSPYAQWSTILLGCGEAPEQENDVLIMLSSIIPAFYKQFRRILEVSDQTPENLHNIREHYRYYHQYGLLLNHHRL